MPPERPPNPPPMLRYAAQSTRFGVHITREPGTVRVVLPILRSISQILFFALIVVSASLHGFAAIKYGRVPGADAVVIVVMLIAVWFMRKWRRFFEVNSTSVRWGYTGPRGDIQQFSGSVPREQVSEIRFSPISGQLIVRCPNQALYEFSLPGDVGTKQEIAAVLREALQAGPGRDSVEQRPD